MKIADVLYPPIKAYRRGRLRVSPIHELYFEESGRGTHYCPRCQK